MMNIMPILSRVALLAALALAGCVAGDLTHNPGGPTNPCDEVIVAEGQRCLPLEKNGSCPSGMTQKNDNKADGTAVCLSNTTTTPPDGGAGGEGGNGGGGCTPNCTDAVFCGVGNGCGGVCPGGRCQHNNETCDPSTGHCVETNNPCATCPEGQVCNDNNECACPPSTLSEGRAICSQREGDLVRDEHCRWTFVVRGNPLFSDMMSGVAEQICTMM